MSDLEMIFEDPPSSEEPPRPDPNVQPPEPIPITEGGDPSQAERKG